MVIEKWKRKDVVEKVGLSRRMRNERKKSGKEKMWLKKLASAEG